MTLTPRKIRFLRRVADDAAEQRVKAVITADDLHALIDQATKEATP